MARGRRAWSAGFKVQVLRPATPPEATEPPSGGRYSSSSGCRCSGADVQHEGGGLARGSGSGLLLPVIANFARGCASVREQLGALRAADGGVAQHENIGVRLTLQAV